MVDFLAYSRQPDPDLDLLEGAVLIAQLAYPALERGAEARRLDQLAAPLTGLGLERLPVIAQARALADHLHLACGFRGNTESYHEPENSFVNQVLERRLGIPISLALVYIEVARRAGMQAYGVGFPGHFLVRIDGGDDRAILDPFFGGEVLDRAALNRLLHRSAPRMTLVEEMLAPVSVRQFLTRMLINLRSIYAARGDAGRLLVVLDRLIDLIPDAADEIRDRGYLCARLGAPRAAAADLRHYVDALPNAGDVAEIRKAIERLEARPQPQH
jgi:regulator of sirC expression with transglutaminase-like and TPR domain